MLKNLSIHLLPILPAWVIALLALGLLALLAYGCRLLQQKQVPPRWVAILGILRLVIVVVFALGLLQPAVSFTRTVEQPPEMLVLVDTSQSMSIPVAPGRGSRLEETLAAVHKADLVLALRRRHELHWFAFDRTAVPIAPDDLAHLQPAGDSTRYAESLTAAWNYRRPAGTANAGARAPARLLLVSDGNDLGTQDVVETAKRLGIVIDTLAPPAPQTSRPPARAAIVDVQCARRILLGSETQFQVTVRNEGATDRAITLRLAENGKEILTQDVSFQGRQEKRVRVSHRPGEIGLKQYTFRLAEKADATPAGDPYQVSVQVVDSKTEVLILEDSWRWEFKFLRRVFENDPSFTFTAFLPRGQSAFVQFGEPDRKVNLGGFPQSRAELAWFDTLVLGDVNPKRWPKGLASALSQVVMEDGKSLVVLAGPNLANLAEVPEIQQLLPIEVTRESARPVEGPVEVRVSPEGARSPFFFNPSAAGRVTLPPMDQVYPPLRKRPAATILLEAATKANAYGNLIVVAEHTVGRGRVLFIGTDTLWKWQTLGPQNDAGLTPYTVFWQQALRALTPTRPGTRGVNLWLQADRSRYEAGQRVVLRAEVESERPLSQPKLQTTVVLPDDKRLPLALAPDPLHPNVFQAEFETTLPGAYRITATAASEGKTAAEGTTVIDVDPPRAELAGVQVDQDNLARIAAATGGKVIDLDDPATWPTSEDSPRVSVAQAQTLDLWNNFTLLLVLCALLGTDWLLRLLRGYV
jgi:hypothetical protein